MFYVLPVLSAVVDTCEDTGITVNSDRSLIAVNYESAGLAIDDDCSLTAGEGAIISIGASHLPAVAFTVGKHNVAAGRAEGDTRRYIHRVFLERALPSGAVQRIVAAGLGAWLRVAADKGQRDVAHRGVGGYHSLAVDHEVNGIILALDIDADGAVEVVVGVGAIILHITTSILGRDDNAHHGIRAKLYGNNNLIIHIHPAGALQRVSEVATWVGTGLWIAADKSQRDITGRSVVGGHGIATDGKCNVKLLAFNGEVHGATAVAVGVGSLVVFWAMGRLNIDRDIRGGGETDCDISLSVVECPLGAHQRCLCVGAAAAAIATVAAAAVVFFLAAGCKTEDHCCYEADLK